MIQAISAIQDFEGQRLAGVDRVRQRITEIENKFGIDGIGQDFQTVLNKELEKTQRKGKTTSVEQSDKTNAADQSLKTEAKNEIETFGAGDSTNNTVKSARPKTIVQNSTTSRTFPGEEALPDAMKNTINPSASISVKPEIRAEGTRVDEEYVETPTHETKRLSNVTSNSSTEELLTAAAEKYNVDPRLAKAVAIAESNMNQDDISDAGAIGVMQLMPETARGLGVDPYDREQNIDGGVRFLGQMLQTFNGDVRKAVAAYNAGPGAVKKYGGIPPYSETQHYVGRVMDLYR